MKKPALIAILLVVLHLVTATTPVAAEGIPQATPKILVYEIKEYARWKGSTYTKGHISATLLIVSDNEIYTMTLLSWWLLLERWDLDDIIIHVKYDSITNTLTTTSISLVEIVEDLADRRLDPSMFKVAGYLIFFLLPKPRALIEKIAGLSKVNVEFPYWAESEGRRELKMATVTIEFGKPLQLDEETYLVIERPKRITYKGYEAVEITFIGEDEGRTVLQGRTIIRSDGILLHENAYSEGDFDIAFELVVEDDVGKVVSQADKRAVTSPSAALTTATPTAIETPSKEASAVTTPGAPATRQVSEEAGLPVAYVIGAVVAVVAAVAATVLAVKLRRR